MTTEEAVFKLVEEEGKTFAETAQRLRLGFTEIRKIHKRACKGLTRGLRYQPRYDKVTNRELPRDLEREEAEKTAYRARRTARGLDDRTR